MPKLRHVRVVNAQFNEGKGIYEDFRMPFNGFNATYELVNGGGKSVLLMLLLQCVLPNTALEQKRPFRDMFSGGDENRTTHVLAEWELDDSVRVKNLLTRFLREEASSTDEDPPQRYQVFQLQSTFLARGTITISTAWPLFVESDEFDVQDYAKTTPCSGKKHRSTRSGSRKEMEYLEWLKGLLPSGVRVGLKRIQQA